MTVLSAASDTADKDGTQIPTSQQQHENAERQTDPAVSNGEIEHPMLHRRRYHQADNT